MKINYLGLADVEVQHTPRTLAVKANMVTAEALEVVEVHVESSWREGGTEAHDALVLPYIIVMASNFGL